jgi:hypothetical protein
MKQEPNTRFPRQWWVRPFECRVGARGLAEAKWRVGEIGQLPEMRTPPRPVFDLLRLRKGTTSVLAGTRRMLLVQLIPLFRSCQ